MGLLRAIAMMIWSLVWTFWGLLSVIWDRSGQTYMRWGRKYWGPQIVALGSLDVTVRLAEGIDWSRPYVVAANHQSQLDIPLLFAALPMPIRFLAKRSLFYIPIFGWSLWAANFIPVDRGRSKKARASIDRGAARIAQGPSLAVFPEGTRSPDGRIKKFKSGAFIMGIKAQVPILPVALRGTFDVVPKSRLSVKPGPVEVIVGAPLDCAGITLKEKDLLLRRTQQLVERMFETGEPTSETSLEPAADAPATTAAAPTSASVAE